MFELKSKIKKERDKLSLELSKCHDSVQILKQFANGSKLINGSDIMTGNETQTRYIEIDGKQQMIPLAPCKDLDLLVKVINSCLNSYNITT